MGILWAYKPNIEQVGMYCPHCNNVVCTDYFVDAQDNLICLECTKALAKAYEIRGWILES